MNVRLFTNSLIAAVIGSASYVNARVNDGLKRLGMENIRYAETENGSITAFEDRAFRSSYYGVGKAIETALKEQTEGDITLIVTDRNGIPQLKIFIDSQTVKDYADGKTKLLGVYKAMKTSADTDQEMKVLKGKKN